MEWIQRMFCGVLDWACEPKAAGFVSSSDVREGGQVRIGFGGL